MIWSFHSSSILHWATSKIWKRLLNVILELNFFWNPSSLMDCLPLAKGSGFPFPTHFQSFHIFSNLFADFSKVDEGISEFKSSTRTWIWSRYIWTDSHWEGWNHWSNMIPFFPWISWENWWIAGKIFFSLWSLFWQKVLCLLISAHFSRKFRTSSQNWLHPKRFSVSQPSSGSNTLKQFYSFNPFQFKS
jgi:hypothetical protein